MNVVIAAGGTGGHVYPAVALAEAWCRRDPAASVTVVGTGRTLEQTMMVETPWKRETLRVRGVVGCGLKTAVPALGALPGAVWRSVRVLRASEADVVIGTGGYTSPPVVVAAAMLGVPRAIVELNAMPGVANRVLGPLANRIFVACARAADSFHADRVVVTGTPLREAFVSPPPNPGSGRVGTILVCGGSQGARAVNSAVIEAVQASSMMRERVTVVHQSGSDDYERVALAYRRMGVPGEVAPFFRDMASALRRADLVISRCGASALAEIAACAKPSILIPFPHAAHNHQEWNARVVEQAGAGIVMPESALSGARLARVIEALVCRPARVRQMAEQSLRLRKTDSAEVMVDECYRLLEPGAATRGR